MVFAVCWLLNWLWQDGPAYVRVFVSILRDIFKEETVEYVLALIDEMLTGILKNIGLVLCIHHK